LPAARHDPRPGIDWARIGVRFVCGAVPGAFVGFGFWMQMCRPSHTLGLGEWFPRQLTVWLGLTSRIDSSLAGLTVILLFAIAAGCAVGFWNCRQR
jgi:hypothetical protein